VPFLRYPLAVASPFSLDEQGQPMPTYPCPRPGRGREVPVRFKGYVNWCGHTQEVIPWPRPDGLVVFVPVLGEAM
jgi:hypothetical protein